MSNTFLPKVGHCDRTDQISDYHYAGKDLHGN